MTQENECEPNLEKYYPVPNDNGFDDFSDITLKNVSMALLLLGLIAVMVNVLMAYLFVVQEWVIIWPSMSMAKIGVILMCVGGVIYIVNHFMQQHSRAHDH